MTDQRVFVSAKVGGVCGITSQVVMLAAVLIAVVVSPWYSWAENYISVLGVEGSATALFNGGFIVTGALSLIFAIGLGSNLLSALSIRLGAMGMVSLVLGSIALSAMGAFPRSTELPHNLASVAFVCTVVLALVLIGISLIMESRRKWGWLSIGAGVLVVTFQVIPWPLAGGAIQQVLIGLPWSLWTISFTVVLLSGSKLTVAYQGE